MDLIPFYSGNIKFSKCIGHVKYKTFIESQRSPKKEIIDLMNLINKASLAGDVELKRKLKGQLFAFTPCVIIAKGLKRRYANMVGFTQYKQLDFDKLPDGETAIRLKSYLFENYPEILCAYLSPSGLGVKCLLKTTRPRDIEQFRALNKAIETHFLTLGPFFDSAVRNAILPLFLSYDPNILFREFEDTSTWVEEDWSVIEYVALNTVPLNYADKYSDKQKQYYLDKTVRLFRQKIRDISTDGHPQLRRACLILGSRCGAGYIDPSESQSLAEQEIAMNSYLQKDLKNYIKTSKWCINQGIGNPKDYN
jgi:hypothetical protein